MSYVCSSVSPTPIAAKPAGSVIPKCQARAVGAVDASAFASRRPFASTTCRMACGDAAGRTIKSHAR